MLMREARPHSRPHSCYASVLGDHEEAKARLARALAVDDGLRAIAIDDPDLEAIISGVGPP